MLELNKDMPIGFMDSGFGGLSVLREAMKLMPNEDFIYYGDSINAPYGTKSTEEIKRLTYDVVNYLIGRGIKGLAVACNTATSAAVRSLRNDYPELPIVGIEPAIKPAVVSSNGGEILVMATPMTIKQEKFHKLLAQYEDQAKIIPVQCEGLMEFVEHGDLDSHELDDYFKEKIMPFISEKTETIVLGCTHYPFLKPHLREFLSNRNIELIDGSLGTSRELKRRLNVKGLLKDASCKEIIDEMAGGILDSGFNGNLEIINSLGTAEAIERSYFLLNRPTD